MVRHSSAFAQPALHRAVLWLLLLALPVYGCAGVLLQMLGPAHRHAVPLRAVVAPSLGVDWLLKRFSQWQAYAHEQAHANGHFVHPHQHTLFERHHHAADDTSVVTLGGSAAVDDLAAELGAAASAGSASLPMGLAVALRVPAPACMAGRRTPPLLAMWRSADPRRRDRPPQQRA